MRPPVLLLLLLAAALAWPAAGGAKLVRNPAAPGVPAVETGGQKPPAGKGPRVCTSPAALAEALAWMSFEAGGPGACGFGYGQEELARAAAALRLAVTEGRAARWGARSVGARGSLRMIRAVAGPAGVPCRAFVHTLYLGRHSHAAPWTACRHGGVWRLKP
jgi:hypothetical protein